jgi:hypothetical protein
MSGYIGNIPTPQATQTRDTFTATSGQTSFATSGYTPGFLDVFLNGVHLVNGTDYTASNGSDVVLTTGATTGDNLEVVAYTTFQVVDQSFSGNFSVDSPTFVVDAATNNVGIGTSSPSQKLQVIGNIVSQYSGNDSAMYLSCDGNTSRLISTYSSTGSYLPLTFLTGGSERARIDASGNLLVGKTSTGLSNVGFQVLPSGVVGITRSGSNPLDLNRLSSDGTLIEFNKDGTTVGSIASRAGAVSTIILDPSSPGGGISGGGSALYPTDHAGTLSDGVLTLGDASARWNNLYLSGGVYLGGTGSANLLDDYEEGAFTPELRASGGTNPTVNYSVQSGFYIKIGRYVFVSINLNWTSQSGGTGLVRVGNLPITPSANSNIRALGSIPYIDCFTGLTNAYGMAVHTSFSADTNGPYFYYHGSDGDIAAYVNIANVASSGALQVCLGYYSV